MSEQKPSDKPPQKVPQEHDNRVCLFYLSANVEPEHAPHSNPEHRYSVQGLIAIIKEESCRGLPMQPPAEPPQDRNDQSAHETPKREQ